jgi:hypothetical protein
MIHTFRQQCDANVSATFAPSKPHLHRTHGSERSDNDNDKTCLFDLSCPANRVESLGPIQDGITKPRRRALCWQ